MTNEEDEEFVPIPALSNPPYFDINEAVENYGFEFIHFKKNSFKEFIKSITDDYENLRKSYIIKDLSKVRIIAHKLKGLFS